MTSTTTDVYQGMADGKPSSRVLAPPGGGSSISFGADPSPPSRMNGNKKNMGSDIFGTGDACEDDAPQKPKSQRNSSNIFGADDTPPSESAKANARMNTGSNIFGGEDQQDGAKRAAGKSNPPGGNAGNPLTGKGYDGSGDSQKKSRGGFNPITGEAYGAESDQQQPSSKKQQASSGASTRPW